MFIILNLLDSTGLDLQDAFVPMKQAQKGVIVMKELWSPCSGALKVENEVGPTSSAMDGCIRCPGGASLVICGQS